MRRRGGLPGDMYVVPTALAPADGAMDFNHPRASATSHLRCCINAGQDRFHVAADMSRLTGKSVTKLIQVKEIDNLPLYLVP